MKNEKITELGIKSGLISEEYSSFDRTYLRYEEKRFAEEIIQECIRACIKEGETFEVESAGDYSSNLYATAIKKHFGV